MTKVTDFPVGQRVRVQNYDKGCEPGETLYDGKLGTVTAYQSTDFVRVQMDEPDEALAEFTKLFFGETGALFEPEELEAVDE